LFHGSSEERRRRVPRNQPSLLCRRLMCLPRSKPEDACTLLLYAIATSTYFLPYQECLLCPTGHIRRPRHFQSNMRKEYSFPGENVSFFNCNRFLWAQCGICCSYLRAAETKRSQCLILCLSSCCINLSFCLLWEKQENDAAKKA
jgi:hypothetical protein